MNEQCLWKTSIPFEVEGTKKENWNKSGDLLWIWSSFLLSISFLSVCKEGDKFIQTLLDLLVLVERQGSGGDLPLAGLQAKHLELHRVLDHEPRHRDSPRLANPVDPVNCLLLHYSPKKFHRWSSLLLLFLLLVWVEKQGNVSHQQDSTTGQAGSSCWQR